MYNYDFFLSIPDAVVISVIISVIISCSSMLPSAGSRIPRQ